MRRPTLLLSAGLCLACGSDPVPSGSTGSTTATGSSTSTGPVADAESSAAGQGRLDLPPPVEMTCQKIDFLFVIDNSGSMDDEQDRLIDGFPGFIAGIEKSIAQYDYHLMVVTVDDTPTDEPEPEPEPEPEGTTGDTGGSTDSGGTTDDSGSTTGDSGSSSGDSGGTTGDPGGSSSDSGGTTGGSGGTTGDSGGPGDMGGAMPPSDPCNGQFGAGRVAAANGTPCEFGGKGQRRYTTPEDEDLAQVFECVADVGTNGSGAERPIWAMAQAIVEQTLPGECNEGYLRDDAILVVTIISDEEDDAGVDSPGDPVLWKDVMVAAKNGDESAIVMLGLVGDTDVEDGVCEPFDPQNGDGAQGAPRLREFVESFERGSWVSVCQDDYARFFNEAVVDIGDACEEFTPPS
ncbi:MAG: hypothetical protein AAF799_09245 [Myxococcota bacterium]